MTTASTDRDQEFLNHRSGLIRIAYRMLGSMADAEDVVQDAYLRWRNTASDIENSLAYLRKTVLNLCLDRMRIVKRTEYVGSWLPEPYLGVVETPELDNPETLVGHLSTAFMLILERLTPLQRAVYLLRTVMGLSHQEISDLLGISAASSRTHHRRARQAMSAEGEGRFEANPAEHRRLIDRFLTAVWSGDMAAMQALLASDVTCHSDGGGKVPAASKPFSGAEAVIKFLTGLAKAKSPDEGPKIVLVNDSYGVHLKSSQFGDSLITINSRDRRITDIFIQRNPEKLAGLSKLVERLHAN